MKGAAGTGRTCRPATGGETCETCETLRRVESFIGYLGLGGGRCNTNEKAARWGAAVRELSETSN
jgi:hypothetical protein